ncbi:hypothetical protein J4E91_007579 [Alternaria rosae]|nr:hypothetical protein J4E91_007579 [Alternaria rosae]
MPWDYDSDSDSDSDGYDVDDPRTREHEAYKIAQENGARARRRYRYGDDVDADGENYSPDEEDNHDSMGVRLQNAREARGWALDEANRRYEWNGQWTSGVHEGVENEADKRMEDVAKWNEDITELERQIERAQDAEAHAADYNDDSDSSSSEESSDAKDDGNEYEKNINDGRSVRARRYAANSDDEDGTGSEGQASEEDEYWSSDDEN